MSRHFYTFHSIPINGSNSIARAISIWNDDHGNGDWDFYPICCSLTYFLIQIKRRKRDCFHTNLFVDQQTRKVYSSSTGSLNLLLHYSFLLFICVLKNDSVMNSIAFIWCSMISFICIWLPTNRGGWWWSVVFVVFVSAISIK